MTGSLDRRFGCSCLANTIRVCQAYSCLHLGRVCLPKLELLICCPLRSPYDELFSLLSFPCFLLCFKIIKMGSFELLLIIARVFLLALCFAYAIRNRADCKL